MLREYSKNLSNLQIYLPVHAPRIVHTSVDVDTNPYKYQRLPKEPRFFFVFFHDNFYKLLRQRYELQSVLPNAIICRPPQLQLQKP